MEASARRRLAKTAHICRDDLIRIKGAEAAPKLSFDFRRRSAESRRIQSSLWNSTR